MKLSISFNTEFNNYKKKTGKKTRTLSIHYYLRIRLYSKLKENKDAATMNIQYQPVSASMSTAAVYQWSWEGLRNRSRNFWAVVEMQYWVSYKSNKVKKKQNKWFHHTFQDHRMSCEIKLWAWGKFKKNICTLKLTTFQYPCKTLQHCTQRKIW